MSVDFWWMLARLSEEQAAALAPRYREAVEAISLTSKTEAALSAWRQDPRSILPNRAHADLSEPFNAAFRSRPVLDLFDVLCCNDSDVDFEPDDSNSDIISSDRVPPAAILAYAFGPRWLSRMPGAWLNCFATAAEVPALAARLHRLHSPWRWQHPAIRARAAAWARQSNDGTDILPQLMTALPRAADQARREHKALLVVTLSPG